MPNYTPVYRLPFLKAGEPVTEIMERTRYMAIDRQLESLFTFLGNGVMSGWDIIPHPNKSGSIIVRPGSGVVNYLAVASNVESQFALTRVNNQQTLYYVYVTTTSGTPHTAAGQILVSTSVYETDSYLVLGTVLVDSQGRVLSENIDMSEDSGRVQLTFLRYLLESISQHVHTGAPGEPDKIDLFNHVKGILSAANIEDLPASKITSGVFNKERFRLSHTDLQDIGTLTHNQLDTLISKFQNVNQILFGDLMTANLLQLILSLKHVWGDVDEYFYNFAAVIPGIDNNKFLNTQSYIDTNATSAEIDFLNHRIRGKFVPSKEIGQYVINSVTEFSYDGNGNITYDGRYVSITGLTDEYGYGYGYGYGEGLDYFDVTSGFYGSSEYLTIGVVGTGFGFGLPEFETQFVGGWGYGYGYERQTGFATTLESTQITLIETSSSSEQHNKGLQIPLDNYAPTGDNYLTGYDQYGMSTSETSPSMISFLIMAADNCDIKGSQRGSGDFYCFSTDKRIGQYSGKLDSDQGAMYLTWTKSNALDMTEDEYMHFTFSQTRYRRSNLTTTTRIPSVDYLGAIPYGGTERRTMPGHTSFDATFDRYWSPDLSMDLIIESTYTYNNQTYRTFSRYSIDGVAAPFLDMRNNGYFIYNKHRLTDEEKKPYTSEQLADLPSLMRLQAHLEIDNLEYLGSYLVDVGGVPFTPATATSAASAASGVISGTDQFKRVFISNITGIYFYTKNDVDFEGRTAAVYGLDFNSNEPKSLLFPMGQRNSAFEASTGVYFGANLTTDGNPGTSSQTMVYTYGGDSFDVDLDNSSVGTKNYRESSMLVDIDRIYVGGLDGFRYDPSNNKVEGMTITFPDPVTLNSISWIESVPSDCIIYLLLKRNDAVSGIDSSYNNNVVYTNQGATLNEALYNGNNPTETDWLGAIDPTDSDYAEQFASKYRMSGSSFPSEYNAVRSVSIQAVLLPSTDLKAAPVLNSIIINFTSDTHEGDLIVSSKDQWSSYRNKSSITTGTTDGGVDYVTIDVPTGSASVIGKVKNLIYGSNGAVIEVGNTNETWLDSVKVFRGNGPLLSQTLPYTASQIVGQEANGIPGYVTCVKKRQNGNIVFLDQDASRIVELDMNYNIQKIVASEYAFKNTTLDWMPSNLEESERYATLLRAIYNPDLGENGVIYFVFSHELKAWYNMYASNPTDYDPVVDGTVDLAKFKIIVKAVDLTFEGCEVVVCDRGVLCVKLTETLGNSIAGGLTEEIKFIFGSEDGIIQGDQSCVTFKADNLAKKTFLLDRVDIERPTYNMIFAPIQGIVAFDIDDDDYLYILKRPRPYPFDTLNLDQSYDDPSHPSEPWYVKMDSTVLWEGWEETTKNHSGIEMDVINEGGFRSPSWEPNFYLDGIYGYRATIQKKGKYLLMCLSGETDSSGLANGVLIFSISDPSSNSSYFYAGPEEVILENDGTYPMSAVFDPITYNEEDDEFGNFYIALSDLQKNSSVDSKSRVIKVDNLDRSVVWQWGTKEARESGLSNSFSLVVNDVSTLIYNDTEIIVST